MWSIAKIECICCSCTLWWLRYIHTPLCLHGLTEWQTKKKGCKVLPACLLQWERLTPQLLLLICIEEGGRIKTSKDKYVQEKREKAFDGQSQRSIWRAWESPGTGLPHGGSSSGCWGGNPPTGRSSPWTETHCGKQRWLSLSTGLPPSCLACTPAASRPCNDHTLQPWAERNPFFLQKFSGYFATATVVFWIGEMWGFCFNFCFSHYFVSFGGWQGRKGG